MSHWKSAPYIAPASISGSLNLSGGFFGSSIKQSPNFPLNRSNSTNLTEIPFFSINLIRSFIHYTCRLDQKKKKIEEFLLVKNYYLLDQIGDESSATG